MYISASRQDIAFNFTKFANFKVLSVLMVFLFKPKLLNLEKLQGNKTVYTVCMWVWMDFEKKK